MYENGTMKLVEVALRRRERGSGRDRGSEFGQNTLCACVEMSQ
jgi:hypothetical protein